MSELVNVNGVTLEVQRDGEGADKPWIVLSNGLCTTFAMWDRQIETLTRTHRVLRSNARGHGRSQVVPAPYAMGDLVGDLVGLMDHFGIELADLMGLSLGGIAVLQLALEHPGRVDRVLCCDSRVQVDDAVRALWDNRIVQVAVGGVEPQVQGSLERWLAEDFRTENPQVVEEMRAMALTTSAEGYMGCARALRDNDVMRRLGGMTRPVTYLVGSEDVSASPEIMQEMAEATPGGSLIEITGGAHIPTVDSADVFNMVIGRLLA
ncbi:3-oxoadipate enol-lactonase [Azorhizobium oxalatiphilum]|uniref:3-oxoadipate enol-lactonase n=1 Tax=Azorhizobium oxalatiphilum TaxID=980631 RepID=A0A917C300_9HYPH|nr:alpha/beta fold hydrolase [Azorhizobium oxalatiphilum]GGF69280.1 3-oxoadipate enol-lactonase [Azorhizobium oxalatiphilum]